MSHLDVFRCDRCGHGPNRSSPTTETYFPSCSGSRAPDRWLKVAISCAKSGWDTGTSGKVL